MTEADRVRVLDVVVVILNVICVPVESNTIWVTSTPSALQPNAYVYVFASPVF